MGEIPLYLDILLQVEEVVLLLMVAVVQQTLVDLVVDVQVTLRTLVGDLVKVGLITEQLDKDIKVVEEILIVKVAAAAVVVLAAMDNKDKVLLEEMVVQDCNIQ